DAARAALQKAVGAGMGAGAGSNALSQLQQITGVGQPSTNSFSGWIADKFKNALHPSARQNAMAMGGSASNPAQANPPSEYSQPPATRDMPASQVNTGGYGTSAEDDGIDHEYDAYINNWLGTPEGQRELQKGEDANIPSPEEFHAMKNRQPGMNLELTGGRKAPSYAE
ncbi:hypothetical protein LRR18_16620, partial [Mangrovimonas sp. AS39]|uniref:hypothetical protein n=1 Tax=Mangrovimonas futianensis TaxID=2895523 RepID=UPI001E62CAF9